MTLAEAINRVMKEEGLTVLAFSLLLGLNRCTVHRYLRGQRIPPLKRLKQMTEILNRRLTLGIENGKVTARFEIGSSNRSISFDAKIEQCRGAVLNYCIRRMFMSKEDAEDTTQEVLLKGMLLHYTWNPEVAMTTWLIGIAKRSRVRQKHKMVDIEEYIDKDLLTDTTEKVFKQNPNLFNHMNSLSAKDRECFRLFFNGVVYKDIATHMNTTEQVIKNRIFNIKQKIKRKIRVQAE